MKGLNAIKTPMSTFKASALEIYAAEVLGRVGELENSVKSLRMAMNFIMNLKPVDKDATDVYRYHYENFLLRLTGTVDRAYRLVGTTLQLDSAEYEKLGGNRFVINHVPSDFPALHSCLLSIDAVATKHKGPRNEVAHSKAFSTRELNLFSSAAILQLQNEEKEVIVELTTDYFANGASELAVAIAEVVETVGSLLVALEPIYGARFLQKDA